MTTFVGVAFSVRCSIMQTPEPTDLQVRRNVVVAVDDDGTITSIEPWDPTDVRDADVVLPDTTYVIPGLVDTHLHAPQWPQLGTGLDLPLEDWLFDYTFPLERRLADPDFASRVWPLMVQSLLAHGTTTAVYFTTIDVHTTTMLASVCDELGQRAFIGRVGMDHPEGTPDWYRDESAADAVTASYSSITDIRALGSPLVQPMLAPRFVPACTDALLAGFGELARETGALVQTHCSESDWEHIHVKGRYGVSDAVALERFGLVTERTILAHGNHATSDDLSLVRANGAGIAHCPLSDSYFSNAVFPTRRALDLGIRLGLGSDVSGGSRPGLLELAADAVTMSRMLNDGVDARLPAYARGVPQRKISLTESFWMATLGGADLLGIPCGLLEVGRQFDAVAIDTDVAGSSLRIWNEIDSDARVFEKIVRLAGPNEISDVWVAGRRVTPVPTTLR